jgi:Uma2 family endonuclease
MAVKLDDLDDTVDTPDGDQVVLLHKISWKQYEAFLAMLGDDHPGIRTHYLEGTLEIMSPSSKHENVKKMLARLVEVYALERSIELNAFGSTTYRRRTKERGLEPDESYFVGREKKVPDIVFEVILSRGVLDRLAIYEGLGVPEVWIWRRGAFEIYTLAGAGYERRGRSALLPELDFTRLAALVERKDQTQAVREFRDALRAGS